MSAWAWAVFLAAGFGAAQGSAANLVEVRVGRHAEFTRVVLETDAPTRYELAGEEEGELRVRLFATATPRRLGSKSSVLREVVIEADPAGAVARLSLKKRGSVDVKQMVLDNPPRIVLDLIPRAAGARAPVTVTAEQGPAPATAKTVPPREEAPQREPEPAAEPAAEPAPAEGEAAPAPPEPAAAAAGGDAAPAEEAPAREVAAPDAAGGELDEQAARDAAALAELDRLAGIVPMTEPSPPAAEEPAAGEASASPGVPDGEAAAATPGEEGDDPAAGFEEREGYEAEAAEAAEVAAMPSRTQVPARGPLSVLPGPFDDPLVLGVVVLLLGLVAGLVVVRQRAARSAEAEASANPFAAVDAFATAGAPGASRTGEGFGGAANPPDSAMGPLFANAAQRTAAAPGASIFDVAEEDAGRYEECTPPASSMLVVDPEEAAPGAASDQPEAAEENVMRVVEELERRIAHLETRLEEVADAKERLERHVAAQTEELRVQRAAIARTQRVLRTIAKPEDLATEPTPKV